MYPTYSSLRLSTALGTYVSVIIHLSMILSTYKINLQYNYISKASNFLEVASVGVHASIPLEITENICFWKRFNFLLMFKLWLVNNWVFLLDAVRLVSVHNIVSCKWFEVMLRHVLLYYYFRLILDNKLTFVVQLANNHQFFCFVDFDFILSVNYSLSVLNILF